MSDFYQNLSNIHPFITVCSYSGQEYVGIIQNKDDFITTFYDYGNIIEQSTKDRFLELAEEWWWQSNQMIPINLFLKGDWAPFKVYLKTFNTKGLVILHGPATSMSSVSKKRPKRRSITLVRKL